MNPQQILTISIFDEWGAEYDAPERYLVHGLNEPIWTSNSNEALSLLRKDLLDLGIELCGKIWDEFDKEKHERHKKESLPPTSPDENPLNWWDWGNNW